MQLPCHIQREFQVHERLFDMMDGARGHLDLEAVVVEIIYDRPAKHADAHGLEAYRRAAPQSHFESKRQNHTHRARFRASELYHTKA